MRAILEAGVLGALLVALAGLAVGCTLVRPEQREFLADPAMTFGSEGTAAAQEEHVIVNREGSYGGSTVTGGGCGCN
ncbi:MAG: DUF4266 domain-containing protein [Sandaracinaceae bacterium]